MKISSNKTKYEISTEKSLVVHKNEKLIPKNQKLSFLKVKILLFETNQWHQIISFALKIA